MSRFLSTIYNMSGRVVSDMLTLAFVLIVLFVETPRKFVTAINHKGSSYKTFN
jgi:hypothetical protein